MGRRNSKRQAPKKASPPKVRERSVGELVRDAGLGDDAAQAEWCQRILDTPRSKGFEGSSKVKKIK